MAKKEDNMDLREYLFHNKITQKKFAEMLDVTPQHIYSIANKKARAGKILAKAIVEFTKGLVTLDELRKKPVDKKLSKT